MRELWQVLYYHSSTSVAMSLYGALPNRPQMFPTPCRTPGQRRQLEKIVDRVEQMTQADRLFFERFPARQHRVRLASQAEIEERRILENLPLIPDGLQFFIVVRQIAPCIRMRALVVAPGDAETDMPESRCRAIFQQVAGRFA
jgi:hypothetical protein